MAEPHDTVDALSPVHWWRFGDASTSITNEGSASEALTEIDSFNGTYQAEAGPVSGSGMEFNGTGGLTTTDLSSSLVSSGGTMTWCFRTNGTPNTTLFHVGWYEGTDNRYNSIALNASGLPNYKLQDAANDDENWTADSSADLRDGLVHTITIQPAVGTGSTPTMYIDGVSATLTHTSGDDGVNNNYWWQNYLAPLMAIGIRGGANTFDLDNIIMYELALFGTVLSASDALAVHVAMTSPTVSYSTKTIRRHGRRLYSANI